VIETERLVLRPPEARDLGAIVRQITDPEVMRYISMGVALTPEDAPSRFASMRRGWDEDGFGRFMLDRRDTGETIGRVGLLVWDPLVWAAGTRRELGDTAEIELGWTLERAAWGRGYATEAATAVRDWALREVAPRRLISLIHPDNVASIAVARRIGEQHRDDVDTELGVTVGLWEYVEP
jgi:RimJ/RimL family protein N-acetyltransferase